ncbi:hypothetical protein ACTWQL_03680 [Pseudalkalibacillus sp. R45]|uniref:hypothetical protein n=1 Tax=Pseudalkalibacillus sp. R45 TaxID=3457433 RepID=UPI003FCC929F
MSKVINKDEKLLSELKENPPKIIGKYKKKGWAINLIKKVELSDTKDEKLVKGLLQANDDTYYPAVLGLSGSEVVGIYFVSEEKEYFQLIPQQIALEFLGNDLLPFKYWTLEEVE